MGRALLPRPLRPKSLPLGLFRPTRCAAPWRRSGASPAASVTIEPGRRRGRQRRAKHAAHARAEVGHVAQPVALDGDDGVLGPAPEHGSRGSGPCASTTCSRAARSTRPSRCTTVCSPSSSACSTRGCLVSSLSSIAIDPGETAQPLHADDQLIPLPRPHVPHGLQHDVGGHRLHGGERRDARSSRVRTGATGRPVLGARTTATVAAEMRRGSVLVYNGSLWHGGGANRTASRRVGIAMNYCAGWNPAAGEPAARHPPRGRARLRATPPQALRVRDLPRSARAHRRADPAASVIPRSPYAAERRVQRQPPLRFPGGRAIVRPAHRALTAHDDDVLSILGIPDSPRPGNDAWEPKDGFGGPLPMPTARWMAANSPEPDLRNREQEHG